MGFSGRCRLRYKKNEDMYTNSTESCRIRCLGGQGWSYGEIIVKPIDDKKILLINTHRFSVTTSKHYYYLVSHSHYENNYSDYKRVYLDIDTLNDSELLLSKINEIYSELESVLIKDFNFKKLEIDKRKRELLERENNKRQSDSIIRKIKKIENLGYLSKNIIKKVESLFIIRSIFFSRNIKGSKIEKYVEFFNYLDSKKINYYLSESQKEALKNARNLEIFKSIGE